MREREAAASHFLRDDQMMLRPDRHLHILADHAQAAAAGSHGTSHVDHEHVLEAVQGAWTATRRRWAVATVSISQSQPASLATLAPRNR